MQPIRLRPTFDIQISEQRNLAIEKLKLEKQRQSENASFQMFGEYGELHLPHNELRLWSPHLSFYVQQNEDHCRIYGRFAPRFEVWTFVWIVYLFMAFSAFFGLVLAYSQWLLQQSLWGLWIFVVGVVAIIILYWVARIGQQWSSDQMNMLRKQLDDILASCDIRETMS